MKKLVLLVFLSLVSLNVLVGCGGPGEASKEGEVTPEQQAEMNEIGKLPGK